MPVPSSGSDRTTKPKMNCPVCAVALVMTERQNIEIDYCPDCRGVWLDRGELDKIIERSQQPEAKTPRDSGRDHRGNDGYKGGHHGRGYGRRSWLQEIFH